MNVLFFPKWNEANPYQKLLADALNKKDIDVSLSNYSPGVLSILPSLKHVEKKIDVIHLHWISPVALKVCWPKSNLVFYIKCMLFILEILFCRFSGKHIVWTIHNRVSHESSNAKREILLRRLLVKASNTIILHSETAKLVIEKEYGLSLQKKARIIHHGNYVGCYPPPSKTKKELKVEFGYPIASKIILYFGAIKPYKGVEKIIESANKLTDQSDLHFIIAGEVENPRYKKKLVDNGISRNLRLDLRFLNDQTMIDYIEMADLIILPFNDTLTSGSVILSMTLGKGLILSHEAKVFGCIEDGGAFYFGNENELFQLLKTTDAEQIKKSGEINLEKSKKMNWQNVADLTKSAYEHSTSQDDSKSLKQDF